MKVRVILFSDTNPKIYCESRAIPYHGGARFYAWSEDVLALDGFDADLHLVFQLSSEMELFRETIPLKSIAWAKESVTKQKLPVYQSIPPVPAVQNVMKLGSGNVEINYNAINGQIFIRCVSWRAVAIGGGAGGAGSGPASPAQTRLVCILNHNYLGDPKNEMADVLLISPESYPLRGPPSIPAAERRGSPLEIERGDFVSLLFYSFPSCALLAEYEIPYNRFLFEKWIQDDSRLYLEDEDEERVYRLKSGNLEIEFLYSVKLLLRVIHYGDCRW